VDESGISCGDAKRESRQGKEKPTNTFALAYRAIKAILNTFVEVELSG
jgi:hypothetical protein